MEAAISVQERIVQTGTSGSAIALIDALLFESYEKQASDIHIDPVFNGLRIRARIDGLLQEIHLFPIDIHAEVIARLKILAGLRTDEHFKAQDGRFRFLYKDTWVDIRISITPTYYGENAVLRLLSSPTEATTFVELGMGDIQQEFVLDSLSRPHGMILSTGPTGSGKTTTLYTLISTLAQKPLSIVTIEDPIEYSIPGVNQIQANERTGLSIANGLRAVLRQDPDVLMVGEIRDSETARLAINAALTGHLLLSTLHTNSAIATVPRLIDMGIDPYLVAATLRLVIAQRLIRRICMGCRVLHPIQDIEKARFENQGLVPTELHRGIGCSTCNGSGYRGRVGIFEILPITPTLQEAIGRKLPLSELSHIAEAAGTLSLRDTALELVAKGLTTLEEVARIGYE